MHIGPYKLDTPLGLAPMAVEDPGEQLRALRAFLLPDEAGSRGRRPGTAAAASAVC